MRLLGRRSLPLFLALGIVTLFLLSSSSSAARFSHARRFRPIGTSRSVHATVRQDLLSQCKELWRNATLDHFTFGKQDKSLPDTFPQRYFLCDHHWRPADDGSSGPILFYFGNEADVELYLNNTGLMWETAPDVGALIVFAEHRYYGKSQPFPLKDVPKHMHYLTAEQAMADYAGLIMEIKAQLPGAKDSAVIGFGGSYGGMLGAWFRMKYPHLIDGVIAASAPIWTFQGETPEMDASFFSKGVTYDASPAGGSPPACIPNVREGWSLLDQLKATKEGRDAIHTSMNLCAAAKLDKPDDVVELRDWLAAAWDFMAMGNFPYPSGYILNGMGQLPAFPVRKACGHLAAQGMSRDELLAGLAQAAGVFYNFSGSLPCFNFRQGVNPETSDDGHLWDYQYCTEMFMPFAKDGDKDMFWTEPFDADAAAQNCERSWGVSPRRTWATQEWGGRRIDMHSNIVFSNGLLDPWHGGGVMRDLSDTLVSLVIPEGAHHLDLMFSHPDDPQSVIEVRQHERQWIRRWIREASDRLWRAQGTMRTGSEAAKSGAMDAYGARGQGRKEVVVAADGAKAEATEGHVKSEASGAAAAAAALSRSARLAGRGVGKMQGVGAGSQW